jgi:hypothetical protein
MNSFKKISELAEKFARSIAPDTDEVQGRLLAAYNTAKEDISRATELYHHLGGRYKATEAEMKASPDHMKPALHNEAMELYRHKEEQKILILFVQDLMPKIRQTYINVTNIKATGDAYKDARSAFVIVKSLIAETIELTAKLHKEFRPRGYFPNTAELYCLPAIKQITYDFIDANSYTEIERLNDVMESERLRKKNQEETGETAEELPTVRPPVMLKEKGNDEPTITGGDKLSELAKKM